MKFTQLPELGDKVSKICLGTMTWGQQNTEEQAHDQMDYALAHEVNFWDTAEMYPSPPDKDKHGNTERFIGSWFAKTGKRNQVVLASKISRNDFLRNGNTKFDKKTISQALDGNLKRLQTDHIDIYQLHWPERQTNFFGKRGYTEKMAQQDLSELTPFLETIEALNDEIKKGRIRAYGLSNDTAWGVMRYLSEAEKNNLAKPITIQNPYSLLNRLYEVALAEVSHREHIGLLAYSPLAFGVLSGKYLNGQHPPNSRLSLYTHFTRYMNEQAQQATQAYAEVAKKHELDMAQMALAFVTSRSFVTANIIGATTLEQLKSNIDSADIELSDEILKDIEAVQNQFPNPAP